ncbi:MAG TPA: ribokinase [Sedimentisphaerales bacterium]|nr:ribokinase [Sedimentisphaerales bacterium]
MKNNAPKIVVVGSSNMDLVVKSKRIPAAGETILGGDFIMVPGGKGANQAVAAAKLGANVCFVAKLGDDVFGAQSLRNFKKERVNTSHIQQTQDAPSGVALIMVDAKGENSIVVAPGANLKLSPQDVRAAKNEIEAAGAVVAQLEIPLDTIQCAAELANRSNVPFVLDPAPARELPPELLELVDVLKPNETEAQILTGIEVTDEDSARAAAMNLLERGVKAVIVTLASKGFLLVDRDRAEYVPAHKVEAIDSTAAGDAFTGSLAVGIAQGKPLLDAASFANYVAALAVAKMGAQSSMPTLQEVHSFMSS